MSINYSINIACIAAFKAAERKEGTIGRMLVNGSPLEGPLMQRLILAAKADLCEAMFLSKEARDEV